MNLKYFFGRKFRSPGPDYVLKSNSAAEISAGVICTCLPTLPALLRQRPTGPGSRSLERGSRSRDIRRERRQSSSKQSLFNEEHQELSGSNLHNEGIEALPAAVTTDIEGGNLRGIQATRSSDLEGKQDEVLQRSAILKTVVIEQSHKVRK